MIAEALGQRAVDALHEHAVGGRGVAVVLARAVEVAVHGLVHAQHLGILLRHPGGTRTAGGGQQHVHAVFVEFIQDFLQPAEVVHALLRLERRPAEDAYAHQVAVRLFHQPHVLVPGSGNMPPLVGIVVPAVRHRLKFPVCHVLFLPRLRAICVHPYYTRYAAGCTRGKKASFVIVWPLDFRARR